MATFLTTRKMSPALAARVEASVRGRSGRPGRAQAKRSVAALARVIVAAGVIVLVSLFLNGFRREKQSVEQARASLLEVVRSEGGALTADELSSTERIESLLVHLAGPYDGDSVAPELRAARGLAEVAARTAVYVRGPIDAFARVETIAPAAATSFKDAFVLCLVAPPSARTEKAVLHEVRAAYSRGAVVEQRTPNVRRLHELEVGLRVLSPAWTDRVRAAKDAPDLAGLRAEFERAPVDRAKRAARATLLVAALDEPPDGRDASDIDGERAHDIRVFLIDLPSGKALLRARRRVDPSVWSPTARSEFSSGLDSCALAYDLHQSVSPERAPNAARTPR